MAVTNGWGQAAKNNTNGFGKFATNTISAGSIYENSYTGDTALIGTSAAFIYSKSSFNQGEADPTPTITGTAGGSFNASANVVFVDTGTFNSSTGQIDLSATSIGSHIITYTVNGVQSGQTVGVTAVPYASTSSFSFDGVNDYFEIPKNDSLSFVNTDFSISIWLNPNVSHNGLVFMNYASNKGYGVYYNSGNLRFRAYPTGWQTLTTINNNEWTHILIVGDDTGNNLLCYKNGVEVYNSSYTLSIVESTDNVYIGSQNGSAFFFNGKIDEVSIWNSALSSTAATEIASGPNDLTTLTNASNTNLKAWYKF